MLDHLLASRALLANVSLVSIMRGDADAPETARNLADSPARLSDHDGVVVYLKAAP